MEWILLFPLAPMICQDFKYRNVALWQLLLFGVMQIVVCYFKYGAVRTGYNVMVNLSIVAIIGTAVAVYAYFRFKQKRQLIGGGDIIFILLLAPYFGNSYFLYFLIASFLLALIGWGIEARLRKERTHNIPLVSYLGICYAIVVGYNSLSGL